MRKIFAIAGNSLLLSVRDPKSLIFALVMPLVATLIMGTALKGMYEEGTINPTPVLVVNNDLPEGAGAALSAALLETPELRKVLITSPATDLEAARAEVTAGKVGAVICIPAGFSADLLTGRGARVQVYADPGNPGRGALVSQVVRSFADAFAARFLDARSAGPGAAGPTQIREVPAGPRPVSAIQYCAAATALLFMLTTALMRSGTMLQERELGTLQRIMATPTTKGQVLAGQIIGSALLNLAQCATLLFGTHFLLGVYWGAWPGALLLGAAFALAAAGIGTAAATVLKNKRTADMASGTISNLFGVLSGALVPLWAFPEPLRFVAKFTPNYWAMQGFLDQMGGISQGRLALPVAVLAAVAAVTGAFGAWRLASK